MHVLASTACTEAVLSCLSPLAHAVGLLALQVIEPKASGGLAANLVSTIRSFLPMGAAKPALPPGAGKKPVKVGCQIARVWSVALCCWPAVTAPLPS